MSLNINVADNAVIIKATLLQEEFNQSYGHLTVFHWGGTYDTVNVILTTDKSISTGVTESEYSKKDNSHKVRVNISSNSDNELCLFCKSNRQAIALAYSLQVLYERKETSPLPKQMTTKKVKVEVKDDSSDKLRRANFYSYAEVVVNPELYAIRRDVDKLNSYEGVIVYLTDTSKIPLLGEDKIIDLILMRQYGKKNISKKPLLGEFAVVKSKIVYRDSVYYLLCNNEGDYYYAPFNSLTVAIWRKDNG